MKRILGFAGCFMFACSSYVSAATLYMDPSQSTLARGDTELVAVRLDTDTTSSLTECVNAVEGVLELDGPIQIVDVSLGDSIFSIWVERPTISANGKQLTFAGGIPNGYCGRIEGDPRLTNNLFDMVLRSDSQEATDGLVTTASVAFTNQTHAYLNDGFGTKTDLQTFPKNISVLPSVGEEVQDPWKNMVELDTTPPQEFSIDLSRGEKEFNGRYYITFNTVDKQTGIDRFEVIEEPTSQFGSFLWGQATAPWVEVRSPYMLKDQNLNSIIRVKAIDKAGNEYIASLLPDEELRTIPLIVTALLILLSVSLLVLVFGTFQYRKRKRLQREQVQLKQALGFNHSDQEATLPHSREDSTDTSNNYPPHENN